MKKSLLILFFCQSILAQIPSAKIDSMVTHAMKKFNVAGTAIAIVKDGKIIHNKGYGVKSITTKEPVNEHTNFAIASNTKAFTCAALAILAEEGKISWTDKVKDHIPEFKMYDDYVTENFNIQDLLTHRSGLGLGAGDLMFFPNGSDFTLKDLLNSFQHFKPQSAFRTKFDYDNLLYIVAGEVIARVSGMSWEQYVQTRIINPLGMNDSYTSIGMMKDKNNLATPHNDVKGVLKPLPHWDEMINGAAGGIYANTDDLCKWMLVQLNKGKYGESLSSKLFTEDSQREMWKLHTVEDSYGGRYNTHFSGYGLGWFLTDVKGNMMVTHTGGLPGMLSITTLIPDLNLGIVILTNTDPGGGLLFSAINNTILDSYLKMDDFGWIDKYHKEFAEIQNEGDKVTDNVWKTVKAASKQKINFSPYIGIYEDKWFGKAEVFMKGKQLWFKCLRSPKLNGPMYFYKANSFAIKWEYQDMNADAFAVFSLDEEGKAQGIKLKGISPNIDFSFDFQDLDFVRIEK
ncbi:serine hydrolase [Flavobacterium sp. Sd200]|uniref:serine hydrolase n=1 Tax=Flavobacterium sp. Sd200 TaxID=2692211 RepID=UPI001370A724|nr:serine hydrolase [Flavobacterium sp. Sd200]MXN89800.1 serine hydrolase [Flavobacterium sp. Sd200]